MMAPRPGFIAAKYIPPIIPAPSTSSGSTPKSSRGGRSKSKNAFGFWWPPALRAACRSPPLLLDMNTHHKYYVPSRPEIRRTYRNCWYQSGRAWSSISRAEAGEEGRATSTRTRQAHASSVHTDYLISNPKVGVTRNLLGKLNRRGSGTRAYRRVEPAELNCQLIREN